MDNSYCKHRLEGTERTCVILHAPDSVSLFHRGNLEAIMAEIPLLYPTNAAVPSWRLTTARHSYRSGAPELQKSPIKVLNLEIPVHLNAKLFLTFPLEPSSESVQIQYIQEHIFLYADMQHEQFGSERRNYATDLIDRGYSNAKIKQLQRTVVFLCVCFVFKNPNLFLEQRFHRCCRCWCGASE